MVFTGGDVFPVVSLVVCFLHVYVKFLLIYYIIKVMEMLFELVKMKDRFFYLVILSKIS